jgi:hypothetical protein
MNPDSSLNELIPSLSGGRLGLGWVCAFFVTHPHPNPPLEREGVLPNGLFGMKSIFLLLAFVAPTALAADIVYPDLPPHQQVDVALSQHLLVKNAQTGIKIEQLNQRRLQNGSYEFNFRAGLAQRNINQPNQNMNEWDIALERPLRLPNKGQIDARIGEQGINRAEQALGDAHHEAGRNLLHLWFNWQREQMQVKQWQEQLDILQQQEALTEKRFKAGDSPKMELNQAHAASLQAGVALQQAQLRVQLAAADLQRQFPLIQTSDMIIVTPPVAVEQNLLFWKDKIIQNNHEIALVQAELAYQQQVAERSRADQMPDPTVGVRFSNEMSGNEKVTGIFLSIPLSSGVRSAHAEQAQLQVELARQREEALRQRLEGDIFAVHTQAVSSFQTWQQAQQTADNFRSHAELVTRAYTLGESSLSETLNARRLALEAALTAGIARLEANESRYRLLLDAHQLWGQDEHEDHASERH